MAEKTNTPPLYKDSSQDTEARIDDLIQRMTLEEKASQLLNKSKAIPRLGILEYNWWNECLHGVARGGKATVFPQSIGLAATFDLDLLSQIASAISDEGRAKFHAAQAMEIYDIYRGLTFWTPNVNIFRDPRWGRGHETYGEDPFLTSQMGVTFVKGIQGDHPKYLKAAACGKHYAVHSGPEEFRHSFNAVVSMKDLHETYLPAFKALVEAGVESIMGAYNRTNGEPCCASKLLLQDILRDRWKFKGHVVSDCWAIRDFHEGHQVTKCMSESAAMALKHGCDLNCGEAYEKIMEAIAQGLITEAEIDCSLARLLRTKFKLGFFDEPEKNPFASISEKTIDWEKHRSLAREAAAKSVVLLKNKDNILPLKKDFKRLFVMGPNAASIEILLGNYFGASDRLVTVMEGIVGKMDFGSSVQYRTGFLLDRPNDTEIGWAVGETAHYDAVVAVFGLSPLIEGEEGDATASKHRGDKPDIDLPPWQVDFMKTLGKGKAPVIAVVAVGSPVNLQEIHELADAVILVWYPGQEGGNGVADVLFGDVSPSGKLPLTFPKSTDQLPPYEDYAMKGRTYRYMTDEPMYPFGFGLSYTKIEYSDAKINKSKIAASDSVQLDVTVKNTGSMATDEVAQLYVSYPAGLDAPLYALKGFQRVPLAPGEKKQVSFTLTPALLESFNAQGEPSVVSGTYTVHVGGSSPSKRALELGASSLQKVTFEIMG